MTDTPTTWRSTPVCATDAMIEAGAAAIRLRYPYMSAGKAWSLAKAVLDAGALASPKPPTLDAGPRQHDWIPSTLSHGEQMCRRCSMTNREAMVLGMTCKPSATGDADHG